MGTTKKIVTLSVLFAFVMVANIFAQTAKVDGKFVTYENQVYEIDVFNQEDAENIVAGATAVYAFKIADGTLIGAGPNSNSSDNLDTYVNHETGEYAVETWYFDEDDVKHVNYIIFSKNSVRLEKNVLPHGFEYDVETISLIGYGSKAGYTFAKLGGINAAVIVCVY